MPQLARIVLELKWNACNVDGWIDSWMAFSFIMNTMVVHSRDGKGVRMVHKIKPPKNQPQTMMGQYCFA